MFLLFGLTGKGAGRLLLKSEYLVRFNPHATVVHQDFSGLYSMGAPTSTFDLSKRRSHLQRASRILAIMPTLLSTAESCVER